MMAKRAVGRPRKKHRRPRCRRCRSTYVRFRMHDKTYHCIRCGYQGKVPLWEEIEPTPEEEKTPD